MASTWVRYSLKLSFFTVRLSSSFPWSSVKVRQGMPLATVACMIGFSHSFFHVKELASLFLFGGKRVVAFECHYVVSRELHGLALEITL